MFRLNCVAFHRNIQRFFVNLPLNGIDQSNTVKKWSRRLSFLQNRTLGFCSIGVDIASCRHLPRCGNIGAPDLYPSVIYFISKELCICCRQLFPVWTYRNNLFHRNLNFQKCVRIIRSGIGDPRILFDRLVRCNICFFVRWNIFPLRLLQICFSDIPLELLSTTLYHQDNHENPF